MELIEQIRGNFPKTIDKSKPVFSSIIANDNNNGAIQHQLIDLLAYMKEWYSSDDIYEQTGTMFDKSATFFSFLTRYAGETEENFKKRLATIFIRNHDKKWGTKYDVKNVFSSYFSNANIYVIENTNSIEENLLRDGDISSTSSQSWSFNNCSVSSAARFSGKYGVVLNQSGGDCFQTVENLKANTTYFLHFFLKGKIGVVIEDVTTGGKYWDFNSQTWKNTQVINSFESADWNNQEMFLLTNSSIIDIAIHFLYSDRETYIDYFRLFEKMSYPSFTVIAHFDGKSSVNVFGLASGDSDPNISTSESTPPQPRYSNYGYFDKSFLSGVPVGFARDIYEDLLDYVRSQGVKAYLEYVVKDVESE